MRPLVDIGEVGPLPILKPHNQQVLDVLNSKARRFEDIQTAINRCALCSRRKGPPVVPQMPKDWNGIILVEGTPFKSGVVRKSLNAALLAGAIDLEQCYVTSVVKCPEGSRPLREHIEACSGFLAYEIAQLLPQAKALIIMGDIAVRAVFGEKLGGIVKCFGFHGVTSGSPFLIIDHTGCFVKDNNMIKLTYRSIGGFKDVIAQKS